MSFPIRVFNIYTSKLTFLLFIKTCAEIFQTECAKTKKMNFSELRTYTIYFLRKLWNPKKAMLTER